MWASDHEARNPEMDFFHGGVEVWRMQHWDTTSANQVGCNILYHWKLFFRVVAVLIMGCSYQKVTLNLKSFVKTRLQIINAKNECESFFHNLCVKVNPTEWIVLWHLKFYVKVSVLASFMATLCWSCRTSLQLIYSGIFTQLKTVVLLNQMNDFRATLSCCCCRLIGCDCGFSGNWTALTIL